MLLGYIEFVALLFIPGIAFTEIFRVGEHFSFVERLGLAFGLSMSIDVLVLAFRTSGILIGSQFMIGIGPVTLEAILGVSALAFAMPVAVRRKLSFYVKPTRDDLFALGIVFAQTLLVYAHFSKYPLFPEFQSVDFTSHVQITADIQAGRLPMFPGGLLYYGVHLLMASLVALSGDLALQATQYAMGILTALSPLLVFVAVNSVAESKRAGLIASLLYVITGFVWFGSVFDAGLYANFYGILSILLLLALVPVVLKSPRNPGLWLAFVIAVGSGYVSHYSYVTIMPALIALPVAVFLVERKLRWPALAISAVAIFPGLVGAALRPDLVAQLFAFIQAPQGGNVTGTTLLSPYLAAWPVLQYLAVVTNDQTTVLFLAFAAFGAYAAIRNRNPLVWIVVVWLLALLAVAPFSGIAWRFSYIAVVPLLIVASFGLDQLYQRPDERVLKQRSKMRRKRGQGWYRKGLLLVVFLILVVNSWSWEVIGDAASNGASNNATQHGILKAMQWLNSTTPSNSQVVAVTNFDFTFYQLLYGRPSGYVPLAAPDDVVNAAFGSTVPTYVVLTDLGTVTIADPNTNPFALYPNDSRFQLQYNDSGVLIYELAR